MSNSICGYSHCSLTQEGPVMVIRQLNAWHRCTPLQTVQHHVGDGPLMASVHTDHWCQACLAPPGMFSALSPGNPDTIQLGSRQHRDSYRVLVPYTSTCMHASGEPCRPALLTACWVACTAWQQSQPWSSTWLTEAGPGTSGVTCDQAE